MTGLRAAVAAYNRAAAELARARRALHEAMDADHAVRSRRRERAECGTPSGYRLHLREEERPCAACTEANTWDEAWRRDPRRWTA